MQPQYPDNTADQFCCIDSWPGYQPYPSLVLQACWKSQGSLLFKFFWMMLTPAHSYCCLCSYFYLACEVAGGGGLSLDKQEPWPSVSHEGFAHTGMLSLKRSIVWKGLGIWAEGNQDPMLVGTQIKHSQSACMILKILPNSRPPIRPPKSELLRLTLRNWQTLNKVPRVVLMCCYVWEELSWLPIPFDGAWCVRC